jgi:hypothetical protein
VASRRRPSGSAVPLILVALTLLLLFALAAGFVFDPALRF